MKSLKLWPLARTDDVLAGFYIPADGRVNPVDVTMSLAKGARQQGARIIEGIAVTGFLRKNSTVTGVRTSHGDIEAEYVVNCAGMWARQVGELAGVAVPLQAAEHYYLLTEPIAEVGRDWPVLEDPANYGYFREEGGGLMLGMFEPVCAPWKVDGIPPDFSFGELPPDWDRMGPFLEKTMSRIPISSQVGIRKFFCGPESFTPDLAPVIGEAPELQKLLRRGRPELDRHPDRRRHWPADGALDRRGPAGRRRHRHEHRPAARLPGQPGVPGDQDRRVAGHGLRHALPGTVDAHCARREAIPDPRPASR